MNPQDRATISQLHGIPARLPRESSGQVATGPLDEEHRQLAFESALAQCSTPGERLAITKLHDLLEPTFVALERDLVELSEESRDKDGEMEMLRGRMKALSLPRYPREIPR